MQQLSGKAPVVKIPIRANHAPNVFVSVLAVRGRVGDVQPTALVDLGKPAFKMGIAQIDVGWRPFELDVEVTTDKPVYRVRDKARVAVQVKRASDGKPPPEDAEVVLVAVDEGLLELCPNESWKLLQTMMQRRGLEVDTASNSMQVVGKRHYGRKAREAGGGGGRTTSRELFDTLLFWQARAEARRAGTRDSGDPAQRLAHLVPHRRGGQRRRRSVRHRADLDPLHPGADAVLRAAAAGARAGQLSLPSSRCATRARRRSRCSSAPGWRARAAASSARRRSRSR